MMIDQLRELYFSHTGHYPICVEAFPSSGSNRRYYRLTGTPTLIGVCGESLDENLAFLSMAQHFRQKGLSVPQVMAVSEDRMMYLQEDMGHTLLFDAIEHGRNTGVFSAAEKEWLRLTIRQLPVLQFHGAEDMDFSVCHPLSDFNRRSILWDLNYFKYCFLKATGLTFQEDHLEDDFQALADVLLSCPAQTFMYRDFQSRNVMLKDGQPWFIDFQGGRKGPFYYDVASFLWQAKANYPESLRQELLEEYLEALYPYYEIDRQYFYSMLRHFVLFRTLQVLGAYGFRGYFEKKPHFLQSVPFAIANLRQLLETGFPEYPYLCQLLKQLTELPQFAVDTSSKHLTVSVMSFSYKKGIPADESGNGGGYVFDCRAVHNPGKYEQYKKLTGLDEPVIRFLEEDGEITTFLEHVDALVDASVARYLKRNFTHLSICFGCTGGQHRSVYSAQHVAEHLHRKFGVKVELEHREQHIRQVFE